MLRYFRKSLVAICLIAAAAAVMLMPAPAAAQILYGSLTGTVTDQQKAAMPGVTVTATNTGTGLATEAVTDETGNYTIRNLQPGIYDVTAVLQGFRELRQRGLNITAGNIVRADLVLQLGQLSETVNVVAESTLLQTEKADLNTEISAKAVTNLPLNQYRNYQTLLNLVPGATPTQFQNALIDTPGQSLRTWVNGTQPNANTTRVDGAVSVNIWLPHHVGYVQPAETIDTVNVATNSFDADTGMAAGAAQTVITKSGTNNLRGSAFWFYNGEEFNANSFFNNANNLAKQPLNRQTYGGTVGGPIIKNKLFYFGSYENFRDRRTGNYTYGVPTAKMRAGDFSEVAAKYSAFRLYDPSTGQNGVGRVEFPNFTIPSNRISSIAQGVMKYYPLPTPGAPDYNSNSLADDYAQVRQVTVDRGNFDLKLTYQRSATHQVWGKFAMLDAEVVDNFNLGWDEGSLGDTRKYVVAVGHTWTLGPSLVLDGNFGYDRQDQTVTGPDYGTNYGLDLGIPGVNDPADIRESGLPTFENGYTIGGTPSWMPLFRKEITYTFSSALTKVFSKHEMRTGVDIVRLELNHRQAEFGNYGLKGGFSFSGNITGASGYTALGWNQFGAFLLGLDSFHGKDEQVEDMTGREWQMAFYIRDRWNVGPKLTLSGGVRFENYPLMTRANSGIEMLQNTGSGRLDYSTYTYLMGGRGSTPEDPGVNLQKWYVAPRVGAAYRWNENNVFRAGYGMTVNPLPWSRPMRGSFPYDTFFNRSSETYQGYFPLAEGIPPVPIPPYTSGTAKLVPGLFVRSPNPGAEAFPGSGDSTDRGRVHSWNFAWEHRLPYDVSFEIAYVGTATNGGYADLNVNYGEPGGGNAARKYFASAGTTTINDWASRTESRYKGLQVALNRPFKNGLMLKGAYTWSEAKNWADEDGWVGLTWNHPIKYGDNFALAGFDRTHVFQMGWVYELPWLKDRNDATGAILGGWQVNGVFGWYSGTPFSIGGTNTPLNCAGCGSVLINFNGDSPEAIGTVGSGTTETYYDKSLFSQPTGLGVEGFGTSKRNQFRRPSVWNVDLSLFKAFPIGRFRPEFRLEAANLFNHVNWGAPVTGYTALNFLQFTPGSAESGTNSPGARRIQIGLRFQF